MRATMGLGVSTCARNVCLLTADSLLVKLTPSFGWQGPLIVITLYSEHMLICISAICVSSTCCGKAISGFLPCGFSGLAAEVLSLPSPSYWCCLWIVWCLLKILAVFLSIWWFLFCLQRWSFLSVFNYTRRDYDTRRKRLGGLLVEGGGFEAHC